MGLKGASTGIEPIRVENQVLFQIINDLHTKKNSRSVLLILFQYYSTRPLFLSHVMRSDLKIKYSAMLDFLATDFCIFVFSVFSKIARNVFFSQNFFQKMTAPIKFVACHFLPTTLSHEATTTTTAITTTTTITTTKLDAVAIFS